MGDEEQRIDDSIEHTPDVNINVRGPGTDDNASPSASNSRKRNNSLPSEESILSPPSKKFEVVTSDEHYVWSLPSDMSEYIKKKFSTYISETDIKNCILYQNPVPENIPTPANLDGYIKQLLEERRKMSVISEDKNVAKIQQKITDVLGPLSRVWLVFQEALRSNDGVCDIPMEDLNELIEQSITLLGVVNTNLTYQRRVNVLSHLMKENTAKQTIKEKKELLTEMDVDLFGQRFKDDWCTSLKTKEKYSELLRKELKPANRGKLEVAAPSKHPYPPNAAHPS